MTLSATLGLALALMALAISPGPGVFLTLSRALNTGMYAALITIAGIVSGDIIYVLIAIYGLVLAAQLSPYLLLSLEIPIAAYLIWYGLYAWNQAADTAISKPQLTRFIGWKYYIEGLLVTLSNPKVILFYGGFLPHFIDLASVNTADVALILLVVTSVIGGIFMGYAILAVHMQRSLQSKVLLIWLNRLAAGAIILAGCLILLRIPYQL